MKEQDDHNIKDTLEHFLIQYRNTQVWLATFRHCVRVNLALSRADQSILLELSDKIYYHLEKLESENQKLNIFLRELK